MRPAPRALVRAGVKATGGAEGHFNRIAWKILHDGVEYEERGYRSNTAPTGPFEIYAASAIKYNSHL